MTTSDATQRYSDYLRRFGITVRGERVMAMVDLDLSSIRFFAYHDDAGLRLKVAITADGWVSAGRHADEDWYGLLRGSTDARAIAERIAWLETTESAGPHGLAGQRTSAVGAQHELAAAIDPAQWAMIRDATLHADPSDTMVLTAWFLEAGPTLMRWTIRAQRGVSAQIERLPAEAVLADQPGGGASAQEVASRVKTSLKSGSERERTWALQEVADSGRDDAVPDVSAVLLDAASSPDLRLFAAGTLARLGATTGIAALGEALREDNAPHVRVACAQALGRIHATRAVHALTTAATGEPDELVRIEIVHALSAQGVIASQGLRRIAEHDARGRVGDLARGYLEPLM